MFSSVHRKPLKKRVQTEDVRKEDMLAQELSRLTIGIEVRKRI